LAFRFVHTADLHLDSPFVGLTTEAPANVVRALRESTISAWHAIVDLALEEQADFILVAGDAFEHANRTLRGQLVFRDGLKRLSDQGIPSFVVTGNHDPLDGWEPSVTWPPLAHRFPAHKVTAAPVLRGGAEIARVYGISYHQRDVKQNLAKWFEREPDATFAIGLLHANVGGAEGHANYAPCTMADLRDAGMDYWALGHVHAQRVLSNERPVTVYCGNPQGRDPGETEPRGCYLVDVDDGGRIRPVFRPLDVVRWQILDVSIGDLATHESLIEAIMCAVDAARTTAGRSVVARVRLVGRGALHASLTRAGVLGDVLVAARDGLGTAEPFAWIESLRDRTRPELDLAERRKADDFVGDLLRRLDVMRSQLAVADGETAADMADADAATDTATDADAAAAASVAAVDTVLDELYANSRARKYLKAARPDAAGVATLLDEVETLLFDRLGDER
jgi:DNA repair exonuclease SbcCD nuclease subunit